VTPVTVILGLVGLGTFVWNTIKGYNKRQDEKEKARKEDEQRKEAIIKKDLELRGEQIKKDAIDTAADVKREVEGRATVIKSEIEATARNLREHNTVMNEMLKIAIQEVDEKVMKMLQDLSARADMTNGNVGKIRNEVQDVKEDVQDLWDRLEEADAVLGIDKKSPNQQARRKREQEFNRRRKRREIEETANEQDEQNRGYRDDARR
jgi:hypothetical protein